MDLEALKICWQREARIEAHPPLDAATVSEWVQEKTVDIHQKVRRRLRREVGYYIPALVALALMGIVGDKTVTGFAFAAGVAIMLGAMMATLWFSERRLAMTPLDSNLHDVLRDLLAGIDVASRAYLAAYVVLFIAGTVIVALLVWWKNGVDWPFVAITIGGAMAIVWSYWSGRVYVDRMFGPYRSALTECLRELNS